MIYLDYSAHTAADERVLERFCETAHRYLGNANTQNELGKHANHAQADIVAHIASMLGAQPEEVIMTSGATEANNTAIKGYLQARRNSGRHVITTCLEHSSVTGPLTAFQNSGGEVDLVEIDRDGKVNLEQLEAMIRPDTVLVSVCMVDSELGVRQPIEKISEIVHRNPKCLLHVDATQAVGKIPVHFEGVDLMSCSAHKFYGLTGSGILLRQNNVVLEPLLHGGSSTSVYRSGTPALELMASTECALQLATDQLDDRYLMVKMRSEHLRQRLLALPQVQINSPANAIPHIVNISVSGIKAIEMVQMLSEREIYLSAKSACSVPGTPSRPVYEITRDRKRALSSFRVSLSHLTTIAEIDTFIDILSDYLQHAEIRRGSNAEARRS